MEFKAGAAVLRLGLVCMFAMAACSGGGADAPGGQPSGSPARVAIDWASRPTTTVALDGGFGVKGCPGDAPFLCVERDGSEVGQIEYLNYPAPEGEGDEELRRRIADDYQTFTGDREGCSEGFEVETVEPEEAAVAGESGLRSEMSVVNSEGEPVERYIKYWLISGGQLHLLNAEAQEEGSCSPAEGTVFTNDALEEFESSFEIVAEVSRFPEGG